MFYGNWCGPYWTAGQVKSTSELTQEDFNVPALNELDEVCKQHDIDLFQASNSRDVRRANRRFQTAAASLGVTGRIFSWLVGRFGPNVPNFSEREILMLPPVANLPATTQMPTKRTLDFELDPRAHFGDNKRSQPDTPNTVPRMVPNQRIDRPIVDRGDSFDMEVGQIFSEAVRNTTNTTNTSTVTAERTGAQSTSSSVTSGRAHHGETEVTYKVTRFNPVDKTQQVIMPWVHRGNMTFASGQLFATRRCFRLNSIYDIFSSNDSTYGTPVVDKGLTPAPDTTDPSPNIDIPAFREFWKGLYHYWHVVECKWKFHYRHSGPMFHNIETDATLCFYEHGMQNPPISTQVGGTQQNIPMYIRKYHPHLRVRKVKPWPAGSDGVNIRSEMHGDEAWETMEGTFRPGNIAHEVVEDEFNQVWHKWNETPPTAEKLTIMLQPGDRVISLGTMTHGIEFTVNYLMEMEFVVQLKDRILGFEFIGQGSNFPAGTEVLRIPPPV
jgi:hypothetical protein